MDADKEGFLRSLTSLIQTSGRCARNVDGRVIMYAKNITKSMKETIDITQERRVKQQEYNTKHNIIPTTTTRDLDKNLKTQEEDFSKKKIEKMPKSQKQELIKSLKIKMLEASKSLEFEEAIRLRDEIAKIKKL